MWSFAIRLLKDIPVDRLPKKWGFGKRTLNKNDEFLAVIINNKTIIQFSCGRVYIKKSEYEVIK